MVAENDPPLVPFELGPHQKQLVAELRSGKHRQTTGKLCRIDKASGDISRCCLGVNEYLAGTRAEIVPGTDFFACGQEGSRSHASVEGVDHVAFWSGCGGFRNPVKGETAKATIEGFGNLADMNDTEGYDFNRLADIIEKYAAYIFKATR